MLDVDGMIAVVLTFDFETLYLDQTERSPGMAAWIEAYILFDGIII